MIGKVKGPVCACGKARLGSKGDVLITTAPMGEHSYEECNTPSFTHKRKKGVR
jgi:hypothetical protein